MAAMRADKPGSESGAQDRARFATTQWSLVLSAGHRGSASAAEALANLCANYWYPLYAHVRRRGHDAEQAQDLVQGFFARLLEKDFLQAVDQQRGRFRSFLLAALDHFLAKEWRREQAQKRGGGRMALPLDLQGSEERYLREPSHELTAARIYERQWALTLIERALAALRDEFAEGGKLAQFDQLKPYLGGDEGTVPYRELGTALHMSEGAVKVAVHRMRRRCRELLRAEIAHTVAGPEELQEELRDLFAAVRL
jgi:RNA polymerase sigma-70 factor (ECF subfamily)